MSKYRVTVYAIDSEATQGYTSIYDTLLFDHSPSLEEVVERLKHRYGKVYEAYYDVDEE